MQKRRGLRSFAEGRVAYFSFSVVLAAYLSAGCAAPGEPQPRTPPVPSAISDLSAHQQGNGVQLTFTLPAHTTRGERLAQAPATEIFRGRLKPDGTPDNKSFQLVYTIPGELAQNYSAQGKLQFTDPILPEQLRARTGTVFAYRVRTRAAKLKDSADSNTVAATLYPVPDTIASIDTKVTQNAIELAWQVPAANPPEAISNYHVYRGELDVTNGVPAPGDLHQAKWSSPELLLATVQNNSYSDSLFEFGKTYVYVVRSVVSVEGSSIESDDSAPVIVTPRDIFPPAAPQNLVAAVLPGENGARVVDLSWSINVEPDLAGYRIYRSQTEGERGQLLQTKLLLSPAYRDLSAQQGQRYWYTVTAVDRAGNESAASEQVLADLSQPGP